MKLNKSDYIVLVVSLLLFAVFSFATCWAGGWQPLNTKNPEMARYEWTWTSDGSQAATKTIGELVGWHITGYTLGPGTGSYVPSSYSVAITDDKGKPLATLSGLSTSITETKLPTAFYPIMGPITVAISSAGSGKKGNIIIECEK